MIQTRRAFLATGTAALASGMITAAERPTKDDISLAAWSLNQSFFVGKRWKNLDLPKIAREQFNVSGLEFVNQFFENPTLTYQKQLKQNLTTHGVTPVLIMVDSEGNLAAEDRQERIQAAIAHRKWIDIASYLGCHAIRCNMGGAAKDWKSDTDLVARAAESFNDLLEYASDADLNIVVENHGGASSDPDILVNLMKAVGSDHFGTLPDFGNINQGDNREEVVRKLVPYAKGISVKASWAADGTNAGWDLDKLLKICMESGYHGFWGIESSMARAGGPAGMAAGQPPSQDLTPDQIWENECKAVRLTKAAIERVVFNKPSA
jgi:L-ribulose-5-phosphate 3-epimerase